MKVLQRFGTPVIPLVIVGVAYAIFLIARLSVHQYDFSVFVVAGDVFTNTNIAPSGLEILQNSDGYDGQFYYRMALTPFTEKEIDFGIRLDYPSYRQARIVYPLLARLFSLGQTVYIPFALVFVNYLALCLMAWLGARFAQMVHLHVVWGLTFALYPGFLFTLSRDTTEIVAMVFLLAAILYLLQQRQYLSGVFFVLAFLTRETTLVVSGILLATIIFSHKSQSFWNLWFPAAIPTISYVIWRLLVENNWSGQVIRVIHFRDGFGIPLLGLLSFVYSIIPPENFIHSIWLIEVLFLGVFTLVVALTLSRSKSLLSIKISWCIYVTMMLFLNQAVWVEDWGFFRVLPEVYVLGIVILLQSTTIVKRWVFKTSVILWMLIGVNLVTR